MEISMLNASQIYQRPKQRQDKYKKIIEDNKTFILLDDSENDEDDDNQIGHLSLNIDQSFSIKIMSHSNIMDIIYEKRPFFTDPKNRFYYKNYLTSMKHNYVLDAMLCGNVGRYFNHGCSPNLILQNVFVDTYDFRFPRVALFAKNSIKAGTELCWDYSYVIGSVEGRVLHCKCNSATCRARLL
jgi:hypothetical protein